MAIAGRRPPALQPGTGVLTVRDAPPVASRPSTGRTVVVLLVLLGVCLAGFAFWFQWRQTRRCLDFLGADVARGVNEAQRVELWRLAAGAGPRRRVVGERHDVSRAPGLVHLRHALVEDASFVWDPAPADREWRAQSGGDWTIAIAFFSRPATAEPTAVLAFDVDGGAMTVVGRPGRVRLGRLGAGLDRWVRLVTGSAVPVAAPGPRAPGPAFRP